MATRVLVPATVLIVLIGAGIGLLATSEPHLDALGTEFTRIALAFAQHKPDEIDSYFGPASLRPAPNAPRIPLGVLSQRARHLVAQLDQPLAVSGVAALRGRQQRLRGEANALAAAIDAQGSGPHRPSRRSFDAEARQSYGMTVDVDEVAPTAGAALVAQEPPAWRFEAYRRQFMVPADRRRVVFEAALDACRARTAGRWTLPASERLDVKWDRSAPAAWHRYEGHGRSTLTITPAALTFVDTAIDLACHEGYPGHHAQFLLADDGDGAVVPIEESVALLRSPVAMLREAAANYAVDLAFPPEERRRFERETLFPLAGLDPAGADVAFEMRRDLRAVEPAIVPILRDYYDGRLREAEASDRLERQALVTSPQALLRFVDDLGPYVLGYTVARDRVAAYVASETHAGRGDAWAVLAALLKDPDPARVLSPISSTRSLSAAR